MNPHNVRVREHLQHVLEVEEVENAFQRPMGGDGPRLLSAQGVARASDKNKFTKIILQNNFYKNNCTKIILQNNFTK